MITNPVLGQRIKHYRKLHSMTQEELAAVIGVASLHINNIENGKKGISLDKLVLICNHFHISLSDILPLGEQDDSELRKQWTDELVNALDGLNVTQLGTIKTMVCSLLSG